MSMHSTLTILVKDRRLDQQKRLWIRNNVRKRECVSFVDVEEDRYLHFAHFRRSDSDYEVCRCGKARTEHPANEEPVRSSDYRVFSEPCPTDVFVDVVNTSGMQRRPMAYPPKQIVRLAADTEADTLKDLVHIWRVPKANYLVCLYGNTTSDNILDNFRKPARELLLTLANPGNVFLTLCSSDASIYDMGLEHLCSADASKLLPSSEILPVAFVPWSDVTGEAKTFLQEATSAGESLEANAIPHGKLPPKMQNCDKGYFLLADYGVAKSVKPFSYVFPFPLRRSMEDILRKHTHDIRRQGSVVVLVGGDFKDLAAVHRAVLAGVPAIVIKESGCAADILCSVMEETAGEVENSVVRENGNTVRRSRTVADVTVLAQKIKELGENKLPLKDYNRYQAYLVHVVFECLQTRHLITVCDVSSSSATPDHPVLVEAAVEAFIKSRSDEDGVEFIRKNIYRLATESMEHPVKQAQRDFQTCVIRVAVRLNRADLLDVVVNHGFVTEDEALCKSLWTKSNELSDFFAFENRQEYVQKIVGCERTADAPTLNAVQHLFLAAVTTNRTSLAVHFWKRGTHQITNALIAHHLSQHMADLSSDGADKSSFEQQASEFESLAIGTMGECYRQNPKETLQILTSPASPFTITAMEAAVWFGIMPFIAAPAPTAYLDHVWKGQDKHETVSSASGGTSAVRTPGKNKKWCTFWFTPRAKYAIISLFYVLFLALYGHVLIFELRKELSPWDVTLAVWVATLILEELLTAVNPVKFLSMSGSKSANVCTSIKAHYDDRWNYIDLAAFIVFIIGFGLHSAPGPVEMRETGRVLLCLDYLVFFLPLLKSLTAHRTIGPMLPMIWNMLGDLIPFLVILFLFIFAYAVAAEALVHPNTEWHALYLLYLPRVGFWTVFGGSPLDIEGGEDCKVDRLWYTKDGGSTCPTESGRHVVPVLMGVYNLLTNVLMLNLLIAYFNHSFENVYTKSNIWWAWLRCELLREYHDRIPVPPPFTLLYRLVQLLACLVKYLTNGFLNCYRRCCCIHSRAKAPLPARRPIPRLCRAERPDSECMMPLCSLMEEYGKRSPGIPNVFREEGDLLEIMELSEFRLTSLGRASITPSLGPAVNASSKWEATRAALHLASKTQATDCDVPRPGSSQADKEKIDELTRLLSRLGKKIEDNINYTLRTTGSRLSAGASSPEDSTYPDHDDGFFKPRDRKDGTEKGKYAPALAEKKLTVKEAGPLDTETLAMHDPDCAVVQKED